jgi:hypothetical protein
MENFYKYHQENNLEKTCPQWINAMNLVANYFLDECIQIEESSENVDGEVQRRSEKLTR